MKKFIIGFWVVLLCLGFFGFSDGPSHQPWYASFEAGIPGVPKHGQGLERNGISLVPVDSAWRVPYDIEIVAMQITSQTMPGPGHAVVLVIDEDPPAWGLRWNGYNKHISRTGASKNVPAGSPIGLQYIGIFDGSGGLPPTDITCTIWYRVTDD